jgi:hypothetical protein
MAYSDNFPATRPVFMADFANGGKIDPRATFTRASTGTFFGTDKVLSSENLLPYSENFGLWGQSGLLSRTGGQTDPAGGSTGFTLLEDSAGGFHRVYQNATASGALAFTVFSKQNSGTRYLTLTLFNANNDWVAATFDLAGGAAATSSGSSSSFSGLTATQTASGNGYYKCVIKATGTIIAIRASLNNANSAPTGTYGLPSYTGDGSSSIDLGFSSLSSTGATDYSYTNGQIHREYQTKLQTAASGSARFEHSATDGQSVAKGILLESASTNLFTYSSDASNAAWTKTGTTATAEAIGPDGQLSAFAVRETTAGGVHILRQAATIGSGSVAFSIYAKLLGNTRRMVLREDSTTGAYATFDLSAGTVAASGAGGSGSIEAVGNGFYRCTMVSSPGAGTKNFSAWVVQSTATTYETYTGDGYSGLLLGMPQIENQSFSSSWISTTSSTATRAADSLSCALSGAGYTGGPFTIVSETEGGQGSYPRAWVISDAANTNRVSVYRNSGAATTSTSWIAYATDGGTAQVSSSMSNTAGKLAVSYDTNNVSVCASGGAVTTDTTAVIPGGLNTLKIGVQVNGANNQLNGHVKRVALYNEALSDTNLQALTS